jgi:protein-S-isoprenylcysteine O-methyltransferase Ste14
MPPEHLYLRRAIVLAGVLIYWIGVMIQARRVRKRIGRSPNLRPRGAKERVLWAGWALVIITWMTQAFLAGGESFLLSLWSIPVLFGPVGLAIGAALTLAGYAGTLWCYAAMGDAWRIGIDSGEKNALVSNGPYRFVRHPIYLFQVVMLAGAVFLLPTVMALLILLIHLTCVLIKASDEEKFLLSTHGSSYGQYLATTGRLFPKIFG